MNKQELNMMIQQVSFKLTKNSLKNYNRMKTTLIFI